MEEFWKTIAEVDEELERISQELSKLHEKLEGWEIDPVSRYENWKNLIEEVKETLGKQPGVFLCVEISGSSLT